MLRGNPLRAALERASADNTRALRARLGLPTADPIEPALQPGVCAACGRPHEAPEQAQPAHVDTSEG
jgi:hypothetical protein